MIKGNKVELVPAELSDKQRVYDWCFHSETTKSHSEPLDYPENPIATWEEFFAAPHLLYLPCTLRTFALLLLLQMNACKCQNI